MRWKNKNILPGDKRIIEKFLWFPIEIDGETRWLEKCKILQCVKRSGDDPYSFIWMDMNWIDME